MDYMFACNLAFELDAFDANGEPLAYFSSPTQQDLLEQIYQHGCYTDDLLLLWGEDGVGKSVLVQALANKIHTQAIVVVVDVTLEMEADDFRLAYQQACEQHQEADDIKNGAQHWLLIDHAEQLQASALEHISEALILLPTLAVCLFSRQTVQAQIQAAFAQLSYQDFYLPALAQEELDDYLQMRLLAAGVPAHELELGDQDLEQIYQQSEGHPREINRVAKKLLRRSLSAPQGQAKKTGLPLVSYMVAGLGVLLLTIGALWFLYQADEQDGSAATAEQAIKPLEIKALDDTREPVALDSKRVEGELSQRLQQAVEEVKPQEKALETVVTKPEVVKVREPLKPKPAVVAAKHAAKPVAVEFNNAQAVLLALDKKHFVLQVAGARNLSSLSRFREDLPRKYRGLIYQRALKGKPWYVLVLGDFDTAKAAKAELKELPKSIQNQQPWAKSVASVQAEIKAAL